MPGRDAYLDGLLEAELHLDIARPGDAGLRTGSRHVAHKPHQPVYPGRYPAVVIN